MWWLCASSLCVCVGFLRVLRIPAHSSIPCNPRRAAALDQMLRPRSQCAPRLPLPPTAPLERMDPVQRNSTVHCVCACAIDEVHASLMMGLSISSYSFSSDFYFLILTSNLTFSFFCSFLFFVLILKLLNVNESKRSVKSCQMPYQ